VDLGPLEPIRAAIEGWRRALGVAASTSASDRDDGGAATSRAARSVDGLAADLARRIWAPLRDHVSGARTVLISPDGALGRFPFGALPGREPGTYLIEDIAIAIAPVPRLLAELPGAEPRPRRAERGEASLLLVGDVDYEADPAGGFLASSEASGASSIGEWRSAPRGEKPSAWPPLAFTRSEIGTVEAAFSGGRADAARVRLERDGATELAFREQAPGRRYIHVATHGFFSPPDLASVLSSTSRDRQVLALASSGAGWHPGLLSGIVLAGANHEAAPNGDDGILTAVELAQLDLRAAELLVLSACETGIGPTAGGEGLLGLQRAAQIAGARSVVASLWKVDDRETQAFMARFYENLWGRRMPRLEALRETQLAFLRGEVAALGTDGGGRGPGKAKRLSGERRPYRASPASWASWVLSGDWR
jgi:CHAT domain-containing protein